MISIKVTQFRKGENWQFACHLSLCHHLKSLLYQISPHTIDALEENLRPAAIEVAHQTSESLGCCVQYLISVSEQHERHQFEYLLRSCFPLRALYYETPATCVNSLGTFYLSIFCV